MAYTEFYTQSGGSNVNAGSTNNNTATYTSIHGNWVTATRVFTPTDSSTPASTISVGMFASVYIDGATVAVYIGRITVVGAGVNGAITVPVTNSVGASPADQTGTATIKVGGAWLGPNGASGFPFNLNGWQNVVNTSSNPGRINLKNDQTYTLTAGITEGTTEAFTVVQGYTSTPGDGGKATFDFGTTTGTLWTGGIFGLYADLIVLSSATSGTGTVLSFASTAVRILRCVVHGSRNIGVNMTDGWMSECEIYDCCKSNTVGGGAFFGGGNLIRCVIHDNTAGVNANGIFANASMRILNCVIETNGGSGVNVGSGNAVIEMLQTDVYNNTGDGFKQNIAPGNNQAEHYIENCNFIKNGGSAINNALAPHAPGVIINNGYGSGTQANGSANVLGDWTETGAVTYPANATPWVDPANGDFRINLTQANWAGRGAFTETATSYAGTVGFPDIGAAQSKTGPGGTFSKEVSYGFNG